MHVTQKYQNELAPVVLCPGRFRRHSQRIHLVLPKHLKRKKFLGGIRCQCYRHLLCPPLTVYDITLRNNKYAFSLLSVCKSVSIPSLLATIRLASIFLLSFVWFLHPLATTLSIRMLSKWAVARTVESTVCVGRVHHFNYIIKVQRQV